jgi:Protein of unknown function (DUF2887)
MPTICHRFSGIYASRHHFLSAFCPISRTPIRPHPQPTCKYCWLYLQAVITAKTLISRSQQLPDSRAIIEMISTIMVYRFTNLTRTEVEAMIGITLQQTRVYQDAKAEGVNEGR